MPGLTFNDTTTKLGLIQDCEFLLNIPDAGISGDTYLFPTFTRLINANLQKVVTMIFQSKDEWDWDDVSNSDYPIAVTDLLSGQQDYVLPTTLNMEKIKRVEISLDGVNWKRCSPFDINQTDNPTDTTSISSNFATDTPFYDIEDNALKLYPIPTSDVTGGLKMWFIRSAVEFTTADADKTKQPPIDIPFHRMLSIGAAYDYAMTKNLPQRDVLKAMLDDYEVRLREHYGTKDEDRRYILNSTVSDTSYQ